MSLSEASNNLIVLARREKILEIVKKIKEPVAWTEEPSETDDNNCGITDVKIKNGQVFTYLKGYKYPIKGWSDIGTVGITAVYKKVLPLLGYNLKAQNWFQRIITLLGISFNKKLLSLWLQRLFSFGNYLLKEEYYQHSTQELRRVLKKYIDIQFVNAIGLVWEYDNAYRYRGQDIIQELNKANLKGYFSTRKEVLRLLNIYLSRDGEQSGDKMQNLVKLAGVALLSPKLNKLARNILQDLDIKKIGFDKGDKYWVSKRTEKYKYNV